MTAREWFREMRRHEFETFAQRLHDVRAFIDNAPEYQSILWSVRPRVYIDIGTPEAMADGSDFRDYRNTVERHPGWAVTRNRFKFWRRPTDIEATMPEDEE